jgi:hypothetical protein
LLKKESNVDFFFLFCTRISWYADTHLIICHTTKELQSMFGLCLSKMAITTNVPVPLTSLSVDVLVAQSGWWCPDVLPFFL